MRSGAIAALLLLAAPDAGAQPVWLRVSSGGAPPHDEQAVTVWTGRELAVLGRDGGGGLYDPHSDRWRAIAPGLPSRFRDAGWTCGRLVVRGRSSAVYDPATSLWVSMRTPPEGADGTLSVWSARGLLLVDAHGPVHARAYDAESNHWTAVPAGPIDHPLAGVGWTGQQVFVWGGPEGREPGLGAVYDLTDARWSVLRTEGAPSARPPAAMLWTGAALVVWGSKAREGWAPARNDGGLYDPATDRWRPIPPAPIGGRGDRDRVEWTGRFLVVLRGERTATAAVWDSMSGRWAIAGDGGAAGSDACTALERDRLGCHGPGRVSILDAARATWTDFFVPHRLAAWAGTRLFAAFPTAAARGLEERRGGPLLQWFHWTP